ncbi:MAG: RNA polymerase sigma factor [Candidatus Yanofskybacteria bacterium]|nr:RNA polymerase sigma factor [Candidatus Yanofskybacteria bacterium]
MQPNEQTKFEEIVCQYQRDLVNFHYRFVGNRYEAEDLAQETFIKVYKKFDTLKEPDKLKSWIFQIARNTVIDFFRKNKNKAFALDSAILENIPETTAVDYQERVANLEVSKELEHCIDQLVKEDRAIIKLLYYEGFSYKEIGELLNINQNTLKSRLHRARKILLASIEASPALKDVVLEYD